ncbi:MAG TPA: maleylpyruvate isomerase family mycothiol-dependent enzyme [Frankiaceae bacterium]|nr:maleylpyruvate isomerase family mycothiol-dependent enzyme [Frankiaceae bacterium]
MDERAVPAAPPAPRVAPGPWPDLRPLLRRELESYLTGVAAFDPGLPTRCPPWTVRDLTRHVAATFERYVALLAQGRRGDFAPPFGPDDLAEVNLRDVRELAGDPEGRLHAAATAFLAETGDADEPIPSHKGTRPVGVQLAFALRELAVHHDDAAHAAGTAYLPPPDVVAALVASYRRLGLWDENAPPEWATFVDKRGS